MTRDEEAPDPSLFDRRIVERNIKRGLITRKDYEKFLKAVPDAAAKMRSPEEPAEGTSPTEGDGVPAPQGTPGQSTG
jgi:hypothetical protein